MAVRTDVALKALEAMAAQARCAVDYMGICHPKPEDKAVALGIVNSTEDMAKAVLKFADDGCGLEPVADPKPVTVPILKIEP